MDPPDPRGAPDHPPGDGASLRNEHVAERFGTRCPGGSGCGRDANGPLAEFDGDHNTSARLNLMPPVMPSSSSSIGSIWRLKAVQIIIAQIRPSLSHNPRGSIQVFSSPEFLLRWGISFDRFHEG